MKSETFYLPIKREQSNYDNNYTHTTPTSLTTNTTNRKSNNSFSHKKQKSSEDMENNQKITKIKKEVDLRNEDENNNDLSLVTLVVVETSKFEFMKFIQEDKLLQVFAMFLEPFEADSIVSLNKMTRRRIFSNKVWQCLCVRDWGLTDISFHYKYHYLSMVRSDCYIFRNILQRLKFALHAVDGATCVESNIGKTLSCPNCKALMVDSSKKCSEMIKNLPPDLQEICQSSPSSIRNDLFGMVFEVFSSNHSPKFYPKDVSVRMPNLVLKQSLQDQNDYEFKYFHMRITDGIRFDQQRKDVTGSNVATYYRSFDSLVYFHLGFISEKDQISVLLHYPPTDRIIVRSKSHWKFNVSTRFYPKGESDNVFLKQFPQNPCSPTKEDSQEDVQYLGTTPTVPENDIINSSDGKVEGKSCDLYEIDAKTGELKPVNFKYTFKIFFHNLSKGKLEMSEGLFKWLFGKNGESLLSIMENSN